MQYLFKVYTLYITEVDHNFIDIPKLPDLYTDREPQPLEDIETEDLSINEGKDPGKITQHTRNPSGPKAPDPHDVNSMKLMPIFGALIAFFGALLLLCRLWKVIFK